MKRVRDKATNQEEEGLSWCAPAPLKKEKTNFSFLSGLMVEKALAAAIV